MISGVIDAGALLPPTPILPKIDTRSSNGLVEVPASKFAAAGVDVRVVAARPDGWPSSAGASSKSSRFSACWPATSVCSAFLVETSSLAPLNVD